MIDLNTASAFWLCPEPVDMRKGRDSLAAVVRERMKSDPINGMHAFIFFSKNLKTVKILHHDATGYEVYTKWFDEGKFLRPVFEQIRTRHTITRTQLYLFLTGAVQTKIRID